MCGITGIFAFNQIGRLNMINLRKATEILETRGPDNQGLFNDEFVGLGHRRLSVIDTSPAGNQPMCDPSNRYHIVYNGEIYNFKEIRSDLEKEGITFYSGSDTEVLLYLYMVKGEGCLNLLNGFFSFAIYDKQEQTLFVARDRIGIKPLYYYVDQDKFFFSSELKSLMLYGINKEIDKTALSTYFQLNYIPAPKTILKDVFKLPPGYSLTINSNGVEKKKYYDLSLSEEFEIENSKPATAQFRELLEDSVSKRMVSDVPLGAFLSGGLDSSIITFLASRNSSNLHTYSIGFRDDKYFDESKYAEKMAKHCKTSHTTFMITRRDMYDKVFNVLDYLDEPFADSSALAVYMLSMETRKHVTVALSGDGADEMLGGYNKHRALHRSMDPGFLGNAISGLGPLWKALPKSRSNSITDGFRKLHRFAAASKLNDKDRYWMLASFMSQQSAQSLLNPEYRAGPTDFVASISNVSSVSDDVMNQWLLMDQNVVLPNDMLYKVDMMSMANSLEVRVPFLDHRLVKFVNSLPSSLKVNGRHGKILLREAFKKDLPSSIINRSKHGFEVPLLSWFRKEMKSLILEDLLEERYITDQGIFDPKQIKKLLRKLYSMNPGDAHATVWALIVFQWWYRKWF